jgi:hypothetical protein
MAGGAAGGASGGAAGGGLASSAPSAALGSGAESGVDASLAVVLTPFDEATLSRCRRLRVPKEALFAISPTAHGGCASPVGPVGFFVHKETSARGPKTGANALGPFSSFRSLFGAGKPEKETPKEVCKELASPTVRPAEIATWPAATADLISGPYRWVPAKRERSDSGLEDVSSCIVWYDPETNGVGQLDASRIIPEPNKAVQHMRKQLVAWLSRDGRTPDAGSPLKPAAAMSFEFCSPDTRQHV